MLPITLVGTVWFQQVSLEPALSGFPADPALDCSGVLQLPSVVGIRVGCGSTPLFGVILMADIGVQRLRCYLILEGLERSIIENLLQNFDIDQPHFLVASETGRALKRLQDDMDDPAWGLQDVTAADLLRYLDLGDLLALLNRHGSTVRNAKPEHAKTVSQIVDEYGAHAIRNRVMHPARLMDPGDYSALWEIASRLRDETPSLNWKPLIDNIERMTDPNSMADVAIPRYWMDDYRVINNLPVAEFEDTGFIGRANERRRLKNLLLSDHRVVTVVGAGGIGKTALAMRVCHDLVDDPSPRFDNVVWVSLKTQFLTADGVKEIRDAVNTQARLLDHFLDAVSVHADPKANIDWSQVIDHMSRHQTLLVVDNLETLGNELDQLAFNVPEGSKLLLTSRVGLGEVERRFPLPDFSPKDAEHLMRSLGSAYGYTEISHLNDRTLNRYCRRLHHNPLLIKWFVLTVGKGTAPQAVFAHSDFVAALNFCFDNVYARLSDIARNIIGTLLASRRPLSRAQIRALIGVNRLDFDVSLIELRQSNVVDSHPQEDGSTLYQISGLVLDYLRRSHPPADNIVKRTRDTIRMWQAEQDRSASAQNTYRYGKYYVLVETVDHRIAAPFLRDALHHIYRDDLAEAQRHLDSASELTPDWSEVHRVRAQLLKMQQSPIYEIEDAFEESITYGSNDINRRDYAVYLMSIAEHERALEQVEEAISIGSGVATVLRSLKALALTRLGRLTDAVEEHKFVWSSGDMNQSLHDRMLQGTQYAECLRRFVEQLTIQFKEEEAGEALLTGLQVVEETAADCGWDDKLTEVAVRLLAERIGDPRSPPPLQQQLTKMAQQWDADNMFVRSCSRKRALDQLARSSELARAMPRCSVALTS